MGNQNRATMDTIQFENAISRMLHERSNTTTSLTEHLNYKKKWLLHRHFGLTVAN